MNRNLLTMVGGTVAVLLASVLAVMACTTGATPTQVQAANAVAAASNAVQPALERAITEDNQKCVDEAESRGDAVLCFTSVETRYRPVLNARVALRAAHQAWADELQAGKLTPLTATRVLNAWCALVRVTPPRVNLPPVIDCSEGPR